MTTMDRRFLTVEDVAKALSIGRSKAYEMVLAGEIPSVKFGRLRRVPAVAFERWCKARESEAIDKSWDYGKAS